LTSCNSPKAEAETNGIKDSYPQYGGAENAEVENAGVENAGVDNRGGKCRSGKCRSDNIWKAVRRENS